MNSDNSRMNTHQAYTCLAIFEGVWELSEPRKLLRSWQNLDTSCLSSGCGGGGLWRATTSHGSAPVAKDTHGI